MIFLDNSKNELHLTLSLYSIYKFGMFLDDMGNFPKSRYVKFVAIPPWDMSIPQTGNCCYGNHILVTMTTFYINFVEFAGIHQPYEL